MNKHYSVTIERDGKYILPTIAIEESDFMARFTLSFSWQTNKDDAGTLLEWYGHRVNVESRSAESLSEASKLAKRITGKGELSPSDLENRLRKLGFKQVVYDQRMFEKVLIADLKPDGYRRYMSVSDNGNCISAVIAADKESAKSELIKRMADHDVDKLADWMARGCPIKSEDYATAPIVESIESVKIG